MYQWLIGFIDSKFSIHPTLSHCEHRIFSNLGVVKKCVFPVNNMGIGFRKVIPVVKFGIPLPMAPVLEKRRGRCQMPFTFNQRPKWSGSKVKFRCHYKCDSSLNAHCCYRYRRCLLRPATQYGPPKWWGFHVSSLNSNLVALFKNLSNVVKVAFYIIESY